jgi:hypothetical protein
MRVFSKKQTCIFYLGQKAFHKKTTGLPTLRISDFSIILSLITQRIFIAETCAWVRWKEILLSKVQKNKKKTNTLIMTIFREIEEGRAERCNN